MAENTCESTWYVRLREASGSTYARAAGFVAEVEEKILNEIAEAGRQRDKFRKTPRRATEHLKDIDHFRSDVHGCERLLLEEPVIEHGLMWNGFHPLRTGGLPIARM